MLIRLEDFNRKKHFDKCKNSYVLLMNEIFINENIMDIKVNKRDEVLHLLEINNLETTPIEFLNSINKSKHKDMLSDYTIDELSNMKLFKVPNYNIGYALKYTIDGIDIISVHNNEPEVRGIGDYLIKSAIRNGGNMLDHFDIEPLNNIYHNNNFIIYNIDKYDPKYDEGGKFARKYGELDVIYRKLK